MRLFTFILLVFAFSVASANNLDDSDQEALKQTQHMLLDKKAREQYIKEHPEALGAHNNAIGLAGSEKNLEEMYRISSQIMNQLAVESQGDAEKMKKFLEMAKENPEAFYNALNNSNKNLIRKLANDIQKIKSPSPNP